MVKRTNGRRIKIDAKRFKVPLDAGLYDLIHTVMANEGERRGIKSNAEMDAELDVILAKHGIHKPK